MRVIHTSDWHLGQNFYGKSRLEEHHQFLTWLLAQVSEHSIDAIIVAGDIFDTGTPPSYARELYFDFVSKVHKLNCQLVVLAGNHDSVAMLGEAKKVLGQLSTYVISQATQQHTEQVFTLKNAAGEDAAVICAIPFIRPRDVLSSVAGQSGDQKQLSLQQAIAQYYQKLFELASSQSQGKLPIIATGHLTTVGAKTTESVREIYIGTLEAFPASAFPAADYIALGHIHRPQKVAKTEHIRYSGSPISLSFDEANQQKVAIMVDLTMANGIVQREITPLNIPCFQPLHMLKTQLNDLHEDIDQLLKEKTLTNDQKIWLDIEIESAEYLQDLTERIANVVKNKPIEVLLVRRAKSARALITAQQENITLAELSVGDVFNTRIEQEHWDGDEAQAQKERLNLLFNQALQSVVSGENNEANS